MSQAERQSLQGDKLIPTSTDFSAFWQRHKLAVATVGCLVFLIAGGIARAAGASPATVITLFMICYVSGGIYSVRDGVASLVNDRRIDVDLLMVLAAAAAASIGEWVEGGILLFLFSLSNALQAYAMGRTRDAITALVALRPREALLVEGEGKTRLVNIDELKVGDVIVVRPGELIPIDGVITTGTSFLDEASITGESIPVEKGPGDEVFGGTLNQHGSLEVRVNRHTEDTVLAKIIRMVEEAQSEEAPTQRKIDTIEQYYAASVIFVTAAAAVIPVLFGATWSDSVYRAITLMVVASPCAVAMAAPAPIVAAIANGARSGVLFKGGAHLEQMATIDVVAVDKTGTLTVGRPHVTDVIPTGTWDRDHLLAVCASVEVRSEHPLATAIVAKAHETGVELMDADDADAVPGQGIVAAVGDEEVWIGNRRLARAKTSDSRVPPDIEDQIRRLEDEGKTVMIVGTTHIQGLIAVVDQIRPQAPQAVQQLKEAGVRRVVMLTGDNQRVADAVAKVCGIDEVHAELLPHEKAEIVDTLRQKYGHVAMVGDGVNDAPALAKASLGVAMGAAGTDVALETADVVLMSNDLNKIAHALRLSRRTQRVIWQNLTFALAVIAVLAVSVFAFDIILALGVIGHEGSTLLVIANSLRLLWGQHRS